MIIEHCTKHQTKINVINFALQRVFRVGKV